LEPEAPGLRELAGDFKRLANDLGLEAFELAGAVTLALIGSQAPRTIESVRNLFRELYEATDLGRLLGMGRAAVAQAYGLSLESGPGLTKQSPQPEEVTAFLDTLGICQQAASPLLSQSEALTALSQLLTARYGRGFTFEELRRLGSEILQREIDFAQKAQS
jgi:aldehyde:ferredoxin oxidoreductase